MMLYHTSLLKCYCRSFARLAGQSPIVTRADIDDAINAKLKDMFLDGDGEGTRE